MTSAGEISLLVLLLVNVAATVYSMRSRNTKMNDKLNQVIEDVHKVELATNSMKDALVAATDKAAHAAGVNEERIKGEAKAAALVATNTKS